MALRHQIMGSMIRFGPVGAFITPNVNDLGHPLVVKIHGQCNGQDAREYVVDLLQGEPDVPSKRDMLMMIAKDPMSQTRFFIFSYQMFMMHVLGVGPVDNMLRHNGIKDGAVHADGRAANLCGGATCSVACAHFPIEEQGRRSNHGHGLVIFNNRQSSQWLHDVLNGSTDEGRQRLQRWRDSVLLAVESMQSTCVAAVPFVLARRPEDVDFSLSSPGYSEKQREMDKFDGKLEPDVREPEKRRTGRSKFDSVFKGCVFCIGGVAHVHILGQFVVFRMCVAVCPKLGRTSRAVEEAANDTNSIGRLRRECPQTGGILSTLPTYLRSPQIEVGCSHGACLRKQDAWEALQSDASLAREDEKKYIAEFAADASRIVEQAGLHAHTASCYKYESGREKNGKPQHCRFGYVHFVTLWCWNTVMRRGKDVKVAVQRVFGRFGKDPVLPRGYELSSLEKEEGVKAVPELFAPQHPGLGSQVNPRDSLDRPGRINTVRLRPRETSTLIGGIVVHRGNLDYQDLRTVLDDPERDEIQLPPEIRVHHKDGVQEVRGLLSHLGMTEPKAYLVRCLRACLQKRDLSSLMYARRNFFWRIEPRAGKAEVPRIGNRVRDAAWKRFSRSVVDGVVEAMRSATQIGFYICDYSTKPNVTTGRVLQFMQRGMARLEAEMREKEHVQEVLAMEAAGILHDPGRLPLNEPRPNASSETEARQDKVRRILIRLWSAANYSLLKGSSLQLLHLLTRREAFRTHRHWQVLTKRLVWAGVWAG